MGLLRAALARLGVERHSVRRHVRAGQPRGRRRPRSLPGRPPRRPLPADSLRLPARTSPITATPFPPSSPRTGGLLPAVLRGDGPDAADARHPQPGRNRLRSRRPRRPSTTTSSSTTPTHTTGSRSSSPRSAGSPSTRRPAPPRRPPSWTTTSLGVSKSPALTAKSTGAGLPRLAHGLGHPAEASDGTGGHGPVGPGIGAEPVDSARRRRVALALAAVVAYGMAALAPRPAGPRSPRRGRARRARSGARADRIPAAAGRHAVAGRGTARGTRRHRRESLRRPAQGRAVRDAGLGPARCRRTAGTAPSAGAVGGPSLAAAGAARDSARRA